MLLTLQRTSRIRKSAQNGKSFSLQALKKYKVSDTWDKEDYKWKKCCYSHDNDCYGVI